MKRAEEKDTAAGYEDPFQPKQAAAAQSSAPAAGPQPVQTQAESSGRYASCRTQLPHGTYAPAMHHQPVSCIWYLPIITRVDASCGHKTAGSVVCQNSLECR